VNSREPAGVVVAQTPAAGGPAIPGTAVNIVVSTGFNAVPESRGAPLQDAVTIMDREGYAVDVVIAFDPAAPPDTVIAQSIPAGSVMPVGTVVTLTINGAAPEQPDPAQPAPADPAQPAPADPAQPAPEQPGPTEVQAPVVPIQ